SKSSQSGEDRYKPRAKECAKLRRRIRHRFRRRSTPPSTHRTSREALEAETRPSARRGDRESADARFPRLTQPGERSRTGSEVSVRGIGTTSPSGSMLGAVTGPARKRALAARAPWRCEPCTGRSDLATARPKAGPRDAPLAERSELGSLVQCLLVSLD